MMAALVPTPSCFAQLPGRVGITFVMPTGVDPNWYDFNFDGQTYTGILGRLLLPTTTNISPGVNGLGGIEFRVPHSNNTGIEFDQFFISSTYAGRFTITPQVQSPFTFDPWVATSDAGLTTLSAQPTSAEVGQSDFDNQRYYSHLEVDSIDPSDIQVFAASLFTVTGRAEPESVPEPGTASLAACLAMGVGFTVRARYKARHKQIA